MSNRGCWIVHPDTGELIPKHLYQRPPPKRSSLPAPMVIRDIEPYQSMVDGSVIGGRKQHRDHLRAHGMVELGNEKPKPRKVENAITEADIATAYDQLEAGYHPPDLKEKPPEVWEGGVEP